MNPKIFKRIPGIGVPTHVIPARFISDLLTLDKDALFINTGEQLLVFRVEAEPDSLLTLEVSGWDSETEIVHFLGDFEVLYRPTDHEIVEALRGPAGPVGMAGQTGSCTCKGNQGHGERAATRGEGAQ